MESPKFAADRSLISHAEARRERIIELKMEIV